MDEQRRNFLLDYYRFEYGINPEKATFYIDKETGKELLIAEHLKDDEVFFITMGCNGDATQMEDYKFSCSKAILKDEEGMKLIKEFFHEITDGIPLYQHFHFKNDEMEKHFGKAGYTLLFDDDTEPQDLTDNDDNDFMLLVINMVFLTRDDMDYFDEDEDEDPDEAYYYLQENASNYLDR